MNKPKIASRQMTSCANKSEQETRNRKEKKQRKNYFWLTILFDCPELFYADYISVLTKTDKILSCVIEVLLIEDYMAIQNIGPYYSHNESKLLLIPTGLCL